MQPDGYLESLPGWVDSYTVGFAGCVGHERRSTDGRPYRQRGAGGGEAVFMDTGAGKGGHLSWVDLAW